MELAVIYLHVIRVLQGAEQKDLELKASLGYIVSSRLAWTRERNYCRNCGDVGRTKVALNFTALPLLLTTFVIYKRFHLTYYLLHVQELDAKKRPIHEYLLVDSNPY